MKAKITVLGAGFGGMELSTILSESLGQEAQVTLIDKSDAFVFGYSKLDVMFGRTTLVGSSRVDLQACKLEYSIVSPK